MTFLLVLAAALLQQPSPPPEQVAGTVVSATDGHPLALASVTLTNVRTEQAVAQTIADDAGHFLFAPVPPGKYRLSGTSSGFVIGAYLGHDQFSTAIVTGAGLPTSALRLELTPSATLSGHIFDDSGQGVATADVSLYRQDLTAPEPIELWERVASSDDGSFEFFGTPPGRYFLSASATPWYAVIPPPEPPGKTPPYRLAVDPALRVAFPTLFFPDTTDPDSAAPLTLHPAEQLTADLHLHAIPTVKITVRLPPGRKFNSPTLQIGRTVFGRLENLSAQSECTESLCTAEIEPGRYTLSLGGPPDQFPSTLAAADLSSSSNSFDLPGPASLTSASVRLHGPHGERIPGHLELLVGSEPRTRLRANVEKGIASLSAIPPGDYPLSVNKEGRLMGILSLSVDGHPIPDQRLHIPGPAGTGASSAGPLTVDLTVADPVSLVEGLALRDGKPAPASMIVLVPAGPGSGAALDPALRDQTFRRDQSDLDGTFAFANVLPGPYILIAVDDGWTLAWTDPAALAPYLLHGIPVIIPATAPSTLHLPKAVPTQPR